MAAATHSAQAREEEDGCRRCLPQRTSSCILLYLIRVMPSAAPPGAGLMWKHSAMTAGVAPAGRTQLLQL
jgi:hypothetical protein